MIRLTRPSIDEEDIEAVAKVLRSGYLVQGARVAAFEAAVAARLGSAHAVAVSSGTAALHLALLALGVGPGDRVAVPAYSWIATANVVELIGATTVFVDVHPGTFDMDAAALAAVLDSGGGSVRAVMPVHAFGQPADLRAILPLCEARGIPVVEDAACALGAELDGRLAGTFGRLGCFSFHPRKAITTGEGGLIVTEDPGLARALRILRNHGIDPDRPGEFVRFAFNYRLTEVAAAMGLVQLAKLDRILGARREAAARYGPLLAGVPVVRPVLRDGAAHAYQSYVVRIPDASAAERDRIVARLREGGVEATIGTSHMPMAACFRERYGYEQGDFPGADRAFAETITLPLYEGITPEDQETVARVLAAALSSPAKG